MATQTARFKLAWQNYRVGQTLTTGNQPLLKWLEAKGYVDLVDEVETPSRPAKLAKKALDKLAGATKSLIG